MKIKKYILDEIDSTNNFAKQISQKTKEDALIIANKQTAGKGRMGRTFFSPEGGIYMSLLLHPEIAPERITGITVMAAVAVAEAIERICGVKPYIKWVNDIYVGNKKVCGILTEGAFNSEKKKFDYAVLGIGINLFDEGVLPDDLKEIAGSLDKSVNKEKLIEKIVDSFYFLYNSGGNSYIKAYKERSNVLGREITYYIGGKTEKGTAIDITDDAKLVVKTQEKIKTFACGEIKLNKNFINQEIKNENKTV